MDGQRFDGLARAFARRTSRRSVLRGAVAVAAVGAIGRRGHAAAGQVTCDEGFTDCGGTCVDLLTDMGNCGECGAVCESQLVTVACIAGECVRTSCPAALPLQCGETVDDCVDPATDPNNCGDCGVVCESGVCADSVCAAGGCLEGQADCGGVCVDTCCDNNNCGACGNVCSGGLTCFEGVCDCPSGQCGEPEPTPPTTLPNTGSGGGAAGSGGPGWAPAALIAAAAVGAAAVRRLIPDLRKR